MFDNDILSHAGLADTAYSMPIIGLADTAYADLTTAFAAYGHAPSEHQRAAIRDLLAHLDQVANDQLDRALYVSAIPAGTGKSQSLAAFARALMDSPDHDDVGMVIFVNRIEEAQEMARAIGEQYHHKLCIYTSHTETNTLGAHATADRAQVCVSTQAALKLTLKALQGAPFGAACRFHFRGARRAVVCWDESFAFSRPVTLDADSVGWLSGAMRRQSSNAATALKRWTVDLDECQGGVVSVPDFEGMGIDFTRLEQEVGDKDEVVAQAKALAVISGDQGYVTRQGANSILVTHYPEIPASLMPVVVTDASARVNASYRQMAAKVPLRWLKDAPKTYRNLALRIAPTAASRSAYRDPKSFRGRDLIDMAARYIEAVPAGERVLVVGYRGRFIMRGVNEAALKDALMARLKPEDQARVSYTTWGRHTATNAYSDFKHVYLMGLNFVSQATGWAASGAALNLNLIDEHPTEDQIAEMRRGMLMDATLQAILRGNARRGIGGDCGEMEAVVVQDPRTGLSAMDYQQMFPGVNIVDDIILMPPKPLKGRLKDLDAIVVRRLEAGEVEMTNQSLWEEMGMQKPNMLALVKKPEWQARLSQLGLQPQPLKGRMMGLRLVA